MFVLLLYVFHVFFNRGLVLLPAAPPLKADGSVGQPMTIGPKFKQCLHCGRGVTLRGPASRATILKLCFIYFLFAFNILHILYIN